MSIKTRMQDSSNWILNSPESLVILMLMGTGIATLFFGVFSTALGFNKNWLFMVLFGIFSLASLKQFIKIFKMTKKLGLKNALGGITAGEFIWSRDKNWKKISGGVEDGNSGYENDEGSNEQDADGNCKIGKEVRDIYK